MPIVSFIIPTLNSQRTLEECLRYVRLQNFPANQYQIIIADGGSTDSTRTIANKYNALIVENPNKTGEAGKMAGLKNALGEYLVFLDSDNILIDPDWTIKMLNPFQDPEIMAAEPIRYDCRPKDNTLTRYFSYIGMGDPLNLFLGNYDRINLITNKWTSLKLPVIEKEGYLKVTIFKNRPLPTIGANGFMIRKNSLQSLSGTEYLFDVDMLNLLFTNSKNNYSSAMIAKVDTGLIHLFSPDIQTFIRKQQRRVRDYIFYQSKSMRVSHSSKNFLLKIFYPGGSNLTGLFLFVVSCVTVLPLLIQSCIGFFRKPDKAWLVHPLLCELTLYIYGTERIRSYFKKQIYDRSNWKQ